jgi:hypothetical protein
MYETAHALVVPCALHRRDGTRGLTQEDQP